MLDKRMEALASVQHGLVARRQAVALGFTESAIRHRLQSGRWCDVCAGVYRLTGAIETPRRRAMAAVLGTGSGATLSHTSAAALLDLPGFTIDPLVVSIPRTRRLLDGVRIEQSLALPERHRRVVDGIPCTSVARTLFDLCGDIRPRRAERALDTALSRRRVTIPALWRVLIDLAVQGRKGTVLMRALLTERGGDYVPPASELEARFIELAKAQGLPVPRRQVDLGDSDSWIGRVDFVFQDAKIVVEVDSAEFHDGLLDRRSDAERDRRLKADGWTVLRFRWRDVTDRPADVARSLRFRGAIASL